MTTMRRLIPAALATTALAFAATPAHAALNPVFGDTTPMTDGTGTIFAGNETIASSHGRVVVIYVENPSANGTLKSRQFDAGSASWAPSVTLSDGSADVGPYSARIAADSDGNITAIWRDESTQILSARTLLKGEQSWGAETQLATSGATARLEPGIAGTVVAAWGEGSIFKVRTRVAGGGSWLPAVDVLDVSPHYANEAALDVNASGDAVLVGDTTDGANDKSLRAARFDHQSGTWTPTASPIESWTTSYYPAFREVALAPDGSAVAVYVDPMPVFWAPVGIVRATYSAPDSNSWSTPEALTASGQHAILPQVVADRAGNFVTSFQSVIDDNSDVFAQVQSSRAMTSTRATTTGSWSTPELLMGDRYGGAGALTVDDNYNIAAIMFSADTLDPSRMGDQAIPAINLSISYRRDGESDFDAADVVYSGDVSVNGSMPYVALDEHGNPAGAFMEALSGTNNRLRVAIGDANGPELNSLSVPTSGVVGDPLTFSVNPFDLFSGIDATSWSFGDGGTALGSSVTHVYQTPGTHTVTVSSSDLSGLATTTTRTVTIAPQPADEPDTTPEEPKVLAPVIEARLSGRTITLTARVQLRSGKKCTGKATATTTLGTTDYRTSLRLAMVGGKCIGTGTIKLKKTPSTRTKLRVKVSAKHIKTRTITTKRG